MNYSNDIKYFSIFKIILDSFKTFEIGWILGVLIASTVASVVGECCWKNLEVGTFYVVTSYL